MLDLVLAAEAAPAKFRNLQAPATIASGGVVGGLVALTSVGAGALGSVAMTALYPYRMTPHRLVATDIAHAIPLALASVLLFVGVSAIFPMASH